jgi:hypothetical protein
MARRRIKPPGQHVLDVFVSRIFINDPRIPL